MNATLEQPSGESVELDGLIQNQKSIVILVRHLG
ncbi:hypothetical protein J2S77_001676 [Alkalibacillus salilacus]|uniref:AhpC/TSA family protein n=1 Tax=Alkalibacillus salilacus TaxID=284582 RepID=A0ABT9VFW5_9BACI|nr:hypothetical protein [Alkalibacillus salilacus]NIK11710.1 hypothetical protein [Alkalibacillus almallahensis]